ncbi:MAG: ABC transporter ATP-binding protein [Spirochaetales bacterium]|nr:ABC transporter ATP-binding protein [Spirochaetales bacterium]
MIAIEGVSRYYGKGDKRVLAVDDLTLTVNRGELYGFLGPNGAGKTTTIKMLAGLLSPSSGTIRIGDYDVRRWSLKVKSMIGYVPEDPILYERMTGIRFLDFIADVFSMPIESRKIIGELADYFEIGCALNDQISSYSHGMRQKTAIIAAMIHDPDVFILDEPIIGLDPAASFRLKEKLKFFCGQGKTVFFSTHVMEVAERLCDRVGIIDKGRLVAEGTIASLRVGEGRKHATLEQLFLELTGEAD